MDWGFAKRKLAGGALSGIAGFVAVWGLRLALPYLIGALSAGAVIQCG